MENAFTKPYSSSKYAKEDLPVWSEIWEQFMMNKAYIYNPDNPAHNEGPPASSLPEVILNSQDIYWRQPHRKLLLGWMANELNKLITEDGRLDEVIDQIPRPSYLTTIGLSFTILHVEDPTPNTFSDPVIYSQISPTTGTRSIFATDDPWVNMADLTGKLELALCLTYDLGWTTSNLVERPSINEDLFTDILNILLDPIRIYFEEPVGWKDENYVPKPLTRRCQNLGVDAAL